MSTLRQKTVSGIGWSVASRVFRVASVFIISAVLARQLTPEDFGLVSMITVFTGFALLFSDSGFGAALVQREFVSETHYSSIYWINVSMGSLFTAMFYFLAPWLADFYNESLLIPLIQLSAFNFLLVALSIVPVAILKRKMNFRGLAIADNIATIGAGILAVALAFWGFGVYSLVGQTLLNTLIFALIATIVAGWLPKMIFRWSSVQELLGFSLGMVGFSSVNYWSRRIDDLLVGRYLGSSALGIYTRAYSIMLLPITQVSSVIGQVMLPSLSRIQNDHGRVKRIYLRTIGVIALITFPAMLGLLITAENFVLAIYGEKWVDVIPVLQILCVVGLMQSVGSSTGWIYQSQGRTDIMFKWGIVATCVTVVAIIIGLQWGVIGVAISYLIRNLLIFYFNYRIAGNLIGLFPLEVLSYLKKTFVSASLMALSVVAIAFVLPEMPHWLSLLVKTAIGIVLYSGLIIISRNNSLQNLLELLPQNWVSKMPWLQSWFES